MGQPKLIKTEGETQVVGAHLRRQSNKCKSIVYAFPSIPRYVVSLPATPLVQHYT